MSDTIRVVAGVLLRSGRVLVALRGPGRPYAGQWEFPGGKVEPGEDDRTALARELHEELRIRVEVGARLAESHHANLHLLAYRCVLRQGEPIALEHDRIHWALPGELPALSWAPADVPLLDAVLRL